MSEPRFPIRHWVSQYLTFTLRLYGPKRFWLVEKQMNRFLNHFPRFIGAEEFTIGDVSAYRQWRVEKGISPKTVEFELRVVKGFFTWMIEDMDLPLFNPVKLKDEPPPPAPNKNRLKLEDFRRLMMEAGTDLQAWIVGEVIDEPIRSGRLQGLELQRQLHEAATRAEMPWMNRVGVFRDAIHGLWKEIIKRECPRLKDVLLEPEPFPTAPPLMGPWTDSQIHELIGGI